MSLGLWYVQTALFNRLAADADLASLGATVYDNVPPSPSFPYIRVGSETITDDSGKDYDGAQRVIDVHIFSTYQGSKECKDLMSAAHAALNGQPLPVDGQQVVYLQLWTSPPIILEKDSITRHGVLRFRALTVSN